MSRRRPERLMVAGGLLATLAGLGGWALSRRASTTPVEPAGEVLVESQPEPGDGGQGHALAAIACVLVLAAGVGGWSAWNVSKNHAGYARALLPGDAGRAPDLIRRYGCGGCHEVSSVPGANGRVGPPLDHVAQRVYLAGRIPNTPENLVRWIHDPHAVDPGTAMPHTGISPEEAQDVAAYLLRQE